MNIIFDLDGTLIDSKLRLYKLFQFLVTESTLTYDNYWNFKQQKISNQQILIEQFNYTESMIQEFLIQWMKLIESQEYLKYDTVFKGIESKLSELKGKANLFVCTARQNKNIALNQLDNLGLSKYFLSVFVTEQKFSKDNLINSYVKDLSLSDWIVGDTGYDIQVGRKLKIKTCAVETGFLSKEVLTEYEPDRLIKSAAEFTL